MNGSLKAYCDGRNVELVIAARKPIQLVQEIYAPFYQHTHELTKEYCQRPFN